MADQASLQDPNQQPTLMAANSTDGTAETRRVIVNDKNQLVVAGGNTSGDVLAYGTVISGTAAASGTLVAAPGAGNSVYINDLSIVSEGAVEVSVGFGTAEQGTTVLARGSLAANGELIKQYPVAVNAGQTNAALIGKNLGAGTVAFNVTYWVG